MSPLLARHFTGSCWLSFRSTCHVSASTMAGTATVSNVNVCIQIPQTEPVTVTNGSTQREHEDRAT
jgi:hypothetical protein